MAIISAAEMQVIEDALDSSGGYVADFTNGTFAHFFRVEVGENLYTDTYADLGTSKGKRLRSYLEKASDEDAYAVLAKLADYCRHVGYRPQWRSVEDYEAIFKRFEAVIARLKGGLQTAGLPDDPTVWLARVSRALRNLQEAALSAFFDATDEGEKTVAVGTKPLLEMHLSGLKALLPEQFPASAVGKLSRHISFSKLEDCRDIARFDVPDILDKAEKFAVALSRRLASEKGEEDASTDIINLVDEIFRRKLIDTRTSEHPDWHGLMLQCSVLLVERFKAVSGMPSDEMGMIGKVFSLKSPVLLVPPNLDTETNRSVQQGAMLLFQGFRQFFRNPHAHGVTNIDEEGAYQALMLATLLVSILSSAKRDPLA